MSPILLEPSKIVKILLLFIGSIILAFASGYYLASTPVPQQKSFLAAAPAVENAMNKKNIDIKKTDKKDDAKKKIENKSAIKPKKSAEKDNHKKKSKTQKKSSDNKKNKPASKPKIDKTKTNKKHTPNNKKIEHKKKTTKPTVTVTKQKTKATSLISNQSLANKGLPFLEADKNLAVSTQKSYSIQVGVFASQENAQKLVDEIKDKKFDAFINEYVSQKGVVKYNVRIGQYAQQTEGREQLAAFKKVFIMPAYIIINP